MKCMRSLSAGLEIRDEPQFSRENVTLTELVITGGGSAPISHGLSPHYFLFHCACVFQVFMGLKIRHGNPRVTGSSLGTGLHFFSSCDMYVVCFPEVVQIR